MKVVDIRTDLQWLAHTLARRHIGNPRRRFHVYRGAALLFTAGAL